MRYYKKKQNTYKNKRFKYKFSPVHNLHDYISNYKKSVASFSAPYGEGNTIVRYSNDEGPYGEAYGVFSDFFGFNRALKFKNKYIPFDIKGFVPKKYKYFSKTNNQYLFKNKFYKLIKDQILNDTYKYKKKFPKTKYYSNYNFYTKYWFNAFLKMKISSIRNIKCFFKKKQYKNKKYVLKKWNINNFSKFLFYMKHTNENKNPNLFFKFQYIHNENRLAYFNNDNDNYYFKKFNMQRNRKLISSYYFRFKRLLYVDTFINYLKPNVIVIPQEELSSDNYRKSKKYLMKQKPKLETLTSKKYDKNIPVYFLKKNILKGLFRNLLKFLKVKKYNFSFYRKKKSYLLNEIGKRWLIQKKMKRIYKWKHFNKYKFFSHMLVIKKFYDCFYVIKNVLNWYTLKHIYIKRPPLYRSKNIYLDSLLITTMPLSKYRYLINKKYEKRRNKRVSFKKKLSSWQKIKYYNYLYWYNYNFKYNFKNISLMMKCYNGSNLSKKKKHTFSKFLPFLLRKKDILRYNCLFRFFSKKKDYSTYNYFYSKKLSRLHLLYLNNRPNFFLNSLFKDISLLFYDQYLDYNYTDHIDEKYSFYLKNIFLSRLSKDIRSKFKLNTFSWFKTNKNSISNFLFVLKFKYHWNYKKINFFLFFNTHYIINSYKKYFYTYNILKYYIFIVKNNLFSFFKDFFIHKYKVSIYSHWLKKKIVKKEDYSFVDVFYLRYNNEYFGKNELKMKRSLRKIIIIDSIFENNYTDWFFFILKSVKYIKKTFFSNYNRSYNYLYKKKIPFIKRKCFLKHIIFHSFEKKKSNFYKFFKKLILFLSKKYKRTFKSHKVKKKDFLWVWSFYKKRFLSCFRHYYQIGFEKMAYYDKNKIYKPLKKKKKRKRELLDYFFRVKKKKKKKKKKLSMTYMLSKNLSHINRLIGSRKFNNQKFNYYFESIKRNNFFKKKTIVSYLSRYKPSFIWDCYSNHKKISLSFKFYIIHYLYNLNNNFLKYYFKIKIFLKYYYIFNFLNFRDYFFNLFLRIKRHRTFLKINNLSNSIKRSKNKSYRSLWYREWWYYFTLSEYSNIFIVFFSYLKKLIFYIYLNNTFSTYKDKIIIYSFKNNEFLLRNSFFQYDYFIRNFLNIEVEEIIKHNN